MRSDVIIALSSLVGTMLGTFAGIYKFSQLTNYKLTQLEEKVEKHNTVIERMFIVEERQKFADNRIDKLEVEIKEVSR